MDIKIQKQLTANDYIAAQFLHLSWRFYALMGVLFFVLFVAGDYVWDPENFGSGWIFGVGLWVIWFSIFSVVHVWEVKRRARKTYAQQKTLRVVHENRITDDMLSTHSEMGDVRHKWIDFHKWKANKGMILVYLSDRMFVMFPRRSFASTDEFEDLQKLLTNIIGPAGKAKKPS